MRHGIAGNKLGRNQSLRKATIRDMAKATLIQERICTTKAKAKEARKMVDKLITLGKKGSLAHKRQAFAVLCDHKLVSDLFNKIAPRFKTREGGYTRIISLGNRRGDNAQLAYLELTEKSELFLSKAKSTAAVKKVSKSSKASAEKAGADSESSSVATATKEDSSKAEKAKEKKAGGIRKMFNRKSSGK